MKSEDFMRRFKACGYVEQVYDRFRAMRPANGDRVSSGSSPQTELHSVVAPSTDDPDKFVLL